MQKKIVKVSIIKIYDLIKKRINEFILMANLTNLCYLIKSQLFLLIEFALSLI